MIYIWPLRFGKLWVEFYHENQGGSNFVSLTANLLKGIDINLDPLNQAVLTPDQGYHGLFQWQDQVDLLRGVTMIRALKGFMAGVFSLAIGWQIWLFLLMCVNFFIPLYFYTYIEAQLTIAAFFAGGMIGLVLVKIQGFTRLLGLMHILWIPLMFYLIEKLNAFPISQPVGLWIRSLLILNGISLLIDFVDVIRYVRGERLPIGERV